MTSVLTSAERTQRTQDANRRVLFIAYHFHSLAGGSGIQRTLRLAQHLPSLGWDLIVLTAHPRYYERTSTDPWPG